MRCRGAELGAGQRRMSLAFRRKGSYPGFTGSGIDTEHSMFKRKTAWLGHRWLCPFRDVRLNKEKLGVIKGFEMR